MKYFKKTNLKRLERLTYKTYAEKEIKQEDILCIASSIEELRGLRKGEIDKYLYRGFLYSVRTIIESKKGNDSKFIRLLKRFYIEYKIARYYCDVLQYRYCSNLNANVKVTAREKGDVILYGPNCETLNLKRCTIQERHNGSHSYTYSGYEEYGKLAYVSDFYKAIASLKKWPLPEHIPSYYEDGKQ